MQVSIARMYRKALVGAAVSVGRAQWQHLPDLQPGLRDQVYKAARLGAEIAAVTAPGGCWDVAKPLPGGGLPGCSSVLAASLW